MGFLEQSIIWVKGGGGHEGPYHDIVVIALMTIKFGTIVKLDVFYTMVAKKLDVTTISI